MKFSDVKIFSPSCYSDFRGDLWTIWKKDEMLPEIDFVHDKVSVSRKNVLRGIHGDCKSSKLVTCLFGEIYLVVVDNRPKSSTYLQWDWIILTGKNRKSVFLPPGYGNGFYVMSDNAIFYYKWSYEGAYPDVEDQFTLKWNDESLNIDWPTDSPILQKRDK
jgi:dTDP-4-dehydrorhamnose 3,5-epimerase